MTKRLVLALCVALSISAACGKDDKDGGGGGGGKAASPLKFTAPELFADYNSGKYKGMDLLDRFREPLLVTGPVKTVGEMGTEALTLWLDVDGEKWIALDFTDKGAAARTKGVKTGDTVTASCKVSGSMENYMQLGDCVLQ